MFDPGIDIASILPVYFIPMIERNAVGSATGKVIGILQLVLKSRVNSEVPEELDVITKNFCDIVEVCCRVLAMNKII